MLKKLTIATNTLIAAVVLAGCSWLPNANQEPVSTSVPEAALPADQNTDDTREALPTPMNGTSEQLLNQAGSASIHIPQTAHSVQLEDGRGQLDNGTERASVTLTPPYAQSQPYTDGSVDLLVVSNIGSGAGGERQYLALFRSANGVLTQTSDLLIGDRVRVTGLTVQPTEEPGTYTVAIEYLGRKPGEAMAVAPSAPMTMTVHVANHQMGGGTDYTQ